MTVLSRYGNQPPKRRRRWWLWLIAAVIGVLVVIGSASAIADITRSPDSSGPDVASPVWAPDPSISCLRVS